MKILLIWMLLATQAFALSFAVPELTVNPDGSTSYEGINCTMQKGGTSDFSIKIIIEKSAKPKQVLMFLLDSEGGILAYCGVEGQDKGDKHLYRLDVSEQYIEYAEFWIMPTDAGHMTLPLKKIPITKKESEPIEPSSKTRQDVELTGIVTRLPEPPGDCMGIITEDKSIYFRGDYQPVPSDLIGQKIKVTGKLTEICFPILSSNEMQAADAPSCDISKLQVDIRGDSYVLHLMLDPLWELDQE